MLLRSDANCLDLLRVINQIRNDVEISKPHLQNKAELKEINFKSIK